MNWLDIVILLVLGILTILGLKRGLIKSLVPLLGIILGILLAGMLHVSFAERLSFIDSDSMARIIAFILILIVVFIVVYILGMILRGVIKMTFLGWLDRLGGAFFGLAMGWIICSVVVVLLARYVAMPVELPEVAGESLSSWVENWQALKSVRESVNTVIDESKLATLQMDSFPVIMGLLPGEFDAVRDFFGM